MKDIANKIGGSLYTTGDYNEGVPGEARAFITDSDQGFNAGDPTQILKSIVTLNASRASYIENAGSTGSAYLVELARYRKTRVNCTKNWYYYFFSNHKYEYCSGTHIIFFKSGFRACDY
jgi:hypothetical protein